MTDIFDIARTLDAHAAEPYLRAAGWKLMRQGTMGNGWRLTQGDRMRNVAVPLPAVDEHDRAVMLVSVLRTLAEVEARPVDVIARDLRDAINDILEFRVIAAALTEGEMPLVAAPDLLEGALDAVTSAARSSVSPRAHYASGTLPVEVRRFINDAKLTGTEKGSVILVIRTPATSEPAVPQLEGIPPSADPFERQVVGRLIDGVRAAKDASHSDLVGTDAVDDAIEHGLSANLCDALIQMSETRAGLQGRIAVRARWALTRPPSQVRVSEVQVEPTEVERLKGVSAILKQIQPIPNQTVQGPVRSLLLEPSGTGERRIEIQADLEGQTRNVRIAVDQSDYELAWRAQSENRELVATGQLERAGRIRELTGVTRLSIAP